MNLLPLLIAGAVLGAVQGPPRPTRTPTPVLGPLKIRARKERMDRFLLPAMRKAGVDSWLVITREGARDPVSFDVAAEHAVLRAACLFVDRGERLERVAIVASFDTETFEKSELYTRVVPYGSEGAGPALKAEIEKFTPKTIAIDTSKDVALADGLTSGNLQWLRETLGPEFSKRLVAADVLLTSFRSKRTPAEVEKMRDAVKKTDRILTEALSPAVIVPGRTTEKDVAEFIRKRRREMGLASSWEEDQDPNVMAGVARGHSAASDALILPGAVVRIDAGVDEDGYKTDLQRLAYVLRPGEKEAPEEVQKAFDAVKAANRAAAAALKPGATGTAVDTAGRRAITGAGYPEFTHATGHPLGVFTHDLGPGLSPDWPDRYGKSGSFTIEKDQTYAVEPSLEVELPWIPGGPVGFGLEEDYLVTATGSEPLGPLQETLILIPSGP